MLDGGRSVRSLLIRNHETTGGGRTSSCGLDNISLPKCVQFDESSDDYRCFCSCFHIKTAALLVAVIEIIMLVFYFVNSLLVFTMQDSTYRKATGLNDDSIVKTTFIASTIGITISAVVIFLLFIGTAKNSATLLVPHIVAQVLVIIVLILTVIDGLIAFSTDSTLFYRLLNAAPFNEHPGTNTVALNTETIVRIYAIFILYVITLILECWFLVIVYHCYRYLDERRVYMQYCLAFSTPMKTLSMR
ncbi:unnamed protein product [Anisakis simplex]|uniref:Lysosomal-associated transmembrane protein (inferred by orthology to a C. elegans protein) n=1 Tax=Anisakis simplex TaxID=6269 RepID=A0A0M3JV77_ANISI|nr:unnamed protein product [Anisakis simplex]